MVVTVMKSWSRRASMGFLDVVSRARGPRTLGRQRLGPAEAHRRADRALPGPLGAPDAPRVLGPLLRGQFHHRACVLAVRPVHAPQLPRHPRNLSLLLPP